MENLAKSLREMIDHWHGRGYGSIKALAQQVGAATGQDVYHRLHRELSGRPSWEVVQWVVTHCAPADADGSWREERLAHLAGGWYAENQQKMPPGYPGRVLLGGVLIRDSISTSAEADDHLTRSLLLAREREEAVGALAQRHAEVDQLQSEVDQLRSDLRRLTDEAADRARALQGIIDDLTDRLGLVHRELQSSIDTSKRLTAENERLRDADARLRQERDDARLLADRWYDQVTSEREANETERRELTLHIGVLRQEVTELRSEVDRLRARPEVDAPSPSQQGDRQEDAPRRGVGGALWDGIIRRRVN